MSLSPTFVAPGTTYRSFCDPTKHADQTNAGSSQSDRTSPFLNQDSLFVRRCLSPSDPTSSPLVIEKVPIAKRPDADTPRSALREKLLNPVARESAESKAEAPLKRAKASVRENLDSLGKTQEKPAQPVNHSFRPIEIVRGVAIPKPKNPVRFIPVGSYHGESSIRDDSTLALDIN